LQEFATAIEQFAHIAYPILLENRIRREAGKDFADRVDDPEIKIQLLLGGEKAVKEALRQALESQAVLLAARPHKTSGQIFWGSRLLPPGEETQDGRHAGAVERQATSRVAVLKEGRQKVTTKARNVTKGL
jgi:hypothetical protein